MVFKYDIPASMQMAAFFAEVYTCVEKLYNDVHLNIIILFIRDGRAWLQTAGIRHFSPCLFPI